MKSCAFIVAISLASGAALADRNPSSASQNALTTASAQAAAAQDYATALDLASRAVRNNADDPWGHYDRGQALVALGRLDEGVTELRTAEDHFGVDDVWGRSIAIWGRARAQELAGRCKEAESSFAEYERAVAPVDPSAARLTKRVARECKQAPAQMPAQPSPITTFSTKAPAAGSTPFDDAVTAFGSELAGAYGVGTPFRLEIALNRLAMAIELSSNGPRQRIAADRIRRDVAAAPKTVGGQGQLAKDAVMTAALALSDLSAQAHATNAMMTSKSRDLTTTAHEIAAMPDESTSRPEVIVSLARADQTLRAMTVEDAAQTK